MLGIVGVIPRVILIDVVDEVGVAVRLVHLADAVAGVLRECAAAAERERDGSKAEGLERRAPIGGCAELASESVESVGA